VENNGVTLEEEIGAVPNEGGGSQSPLKMKKVTLPSGDLVGAARALRMTLRHEVSYKTSRVARNRGQSKAGTEIRHSEMIDVTDEEMKIYAGEQPVLTLVECDSGITAAVVLPESFKPRNKTARSSIAKEDLKECIISGLVLIPSTIEDDNREGQFEWPITKKSVFRLEVCGGNLTLLNPDICRREDGVMFYRASFMDMRNCLDALFIKFSALSQNEGGVLPDSAAIKTSAFPYKRMDGSIPLLAEGSGSVGHVASSKASIQASRSDAQFYNCVIEGCNAKVQKKNGRHHAAFHIVSNRQEILETCARFSRLCGMCAAHPASRYAAIAETTCPVWILKKSRVERAYCRCKVFGECNLSIKT
jgi:hypothetical protein